MLINLNPLSNFYLKKTSKVLLIFLLVIISCSKDSNLPVPDTGEEPELPLKITKITPLKGIVGDEVIIEGDNWSTDTSKVKVFLGDENSEITELTQNKIIFKVPTLNPNNYKIKLVSGTKELIANDLFEVIKTPTETFKIEEISPASNSYAIIPKENGVRYFKVDLTFNHAVKPITFTADEVVNQTNPALKKSIKRELFAFLGENKIENRQLENNLTSITVDDSFPDRIYDNNGEFNDVIVHDESTPNKLSLFLSYTGEFAHQYLGDGLISFSIPAGVFYVDNGDDEPYLNEEIAVNWHLNVLRANDVRVLEFNKFYKTNENTIKAQLSGLVDIDNMELVIKNEKTGNVIQTITGSQLTHQSKDLFSKSVPNIASVNSFTQKGSSIEFTRNSFDGELLLKVKNPAEIKGDVPYYNSPNTSSLTINKGEVKFKELDFSVDKDGVKPTLEMTPSDDNSNLNAGEIVKIFDSVKLKLSEPLSFKQGMFKISYLESGDKDYTLQELKPFYNESNYTFTIPFTTFRSNGRSITDLKIDAINVVDYGGNEMDKLQYTATTYVPKDEARKITIPSTSWVKEKITRPNGFSGMNAEVYKYEAPLDLGFNTSGLSEIVQPSASLTLFGDLFKKSTYNFEYFALNSPSLFNNSTVNGTLLTVSGLPVNLWKLNGNKIIFYSNDDFTITKDHTVDITSIKVYGVDSNNKYKARHPW